MEIDSLKKALKNRVLFYAEKTPKICYSNDRKRKGNKKMNCMNCGTKLGPDGRCPVCLPQPAYYGAPMRPTVVQRDARSITAIIFSLLALLYLVYQLVGRWKIYFDDNGEFVYAPLKNDFFFRAMIILFTAGMLLYFITAANRIVGVLATILGVAATGWSVWNSYNMIDIWIQQGRKYPDIANPGQAIVTVYTILMTLGMLFLVIAFARSLGSKSVVGLSVAASVLFVAASVGYGAGYTLMLRVPMATAFKPMALFIIALPLVLLGLAMCFYAMARGRVPVN